MSDENPKDYASPACLAAEVAPDYFDPLATDPVAAADAARWRKAARAQLLAARGARDVQATDAAIADQLDRLLAQQFGGGPGLILAAYWPIRGEPDLRPWMARQSAAGLRIALPVVTAPDQPLVFRPWSPDAQMRPGRWNIPEPATTAQVLPQIVLAPTVGWDAGRFRLGYGGGFYDRTLAALRPRPYAVGIGLESGRLPTIYPQPHDAALDLIVTEAGFRP
ncbi:5-formyltetrahydrofolate cyclo-ligase [Paracoccus xiamenensis]|uniref:5-formyltetrahydrofolate cyclo-ligase n=1 Tax=Paracoccus xiamenensis TaxID=2714901 RepID=UPI00140E63E4|nr:5-formyltetrahydrofolate cyclo-ligase [Paracoccus xiamenensis]NHF74122.1 5-formyltetrahydrofolate cyclo-ligase [Paracoccus xiamenensis]